MRDGADHLSNELRKIPVVFACSGMRRLRSVLFYGRTSGDADLGDVAADDPKAVGTDLAHDSGSDPENICLVFRQACAHAETACGDAPDGARGKKDAPGCRGRLSGAACAKCPEAVTDRRHDAGGI